MLWEAVEDDKITATTVKNRLRDAKAEKADAEEIAALNFVTKLYATETVAKKALKDAVAQLDTKALAQYGKVTTDDIKALVIDDKWGAAVAAGISDELVAAAQRFTGRLRLLAERYSATIDQLDAEIQRLSTRLNQHLASMGVLE